MLGLLYASYPSLHTTVLVAISSTIHCQPSHLQECVVVYILIASRKTLAKPASKNLSNPTPIINAVTRRWTKQERKKACLRD